MGEFQAYQPLHAKLMSFNGDVEKLYREAVEQRSEEIRKDNLREVTERLYGSLQPLAKFEKLKVTKDNAPTFTSIYKLLESYSKIAPGDTGKMESLGKEAGFTQEESLCLYNMCRYAKAIDNIRSQHEQTVAFVVGNV